jgi:hypothetical protein
MMPLAKLWTWIGQLFIPLAIGWAIYIQNGFGDKSPPDGVLISRAYWGVLVSLLAGAALAWTFSFYVRAAQRKRVKLLVPPNTAFEEAKDRSPIISYGTASVFVLCVLVAIVIFGLRYSKSEIYGWNATTSLEQGFWRSRLKAHQDGCNSNPCYAVGARVDRSNNAPVFGVNEYVLYLTDGVLLLLLLFFASGIAYAGGFLARHLRLRLQFPSG